ncbi:uncharacterized protein PGTG_05148 [Puccinia graminis f. sp. tritici CRL 75-36-700-3]|uniref:Uncharacterized protein n=1 Tax=Puccinia graminis f. sp. tritici (strain CRL 75-36-700-3 / race SCCL) TaxID=418459 RepID=E3K6S3_PUCGT|nr:uncharacterized protein PGTG_05148 [Puccinia graminis f. sp. tritici CRL 75-36-700-3]EFP79923.1 hypothetical protein PGTG_05148 [Puccinia graminis f. sp. tritici CRL 75-36-700-3]
MEKNGSVTLDSESQSIRSLLRDTLSSLNLTEHDGPATSDSRSTWKDIDSLNLICNGGDQAITEDRSYFHPAGTACGGFEGTQIPRSWLTGTAKLDQPASPNLLQDAELTEASQMESLEEILRPRGTLFVGCSVPS